MGNKADIRTAESLKRVMFKSYPVVVQCGRPLVHCSEAGLTRFSSHIWCLWLVKLCAA